jgi:hypothetical protein
MLLLMAFAYGWISSGDVDKGFLVLLSSLSRLM